LFDRRCAAFGAGLAHVRQAGPAAALRALRACSMSVRVMLEQFRELVDVQGDNHAMDYPAYTDLRFGFEITMYIANR